MTTVNVLTDIPPMADPDDRARWRTLQARANALAASATHHSSSDGDWDTRELLALKWAMGYVYSVAEQLAETCQHADYSGETSRGVHTTTCHECGAILDQEDVGS